MTITANSVRNPPSINPRINSATAKKTEPLIIVPKAVRIGALIVLWILVSINRSKPKNIRAVMGLSIMLAIWPPGTPVVNAETIPVKTDKSMTYFVLGINIIPRNIIDNNISGFIPNKMGGTTV